MSGAQNLPKYQNTTFFYVRCTKPISILKQIFLCQALKTYQDTKTLHLSMLGAQNLPGYQNTTLFYVRRRKPITILEHYIFLCQARKTYQDTRTNFLCQAHKTYQDTRTLHFFMSGVQNLPEYQNTTFFHVKFSRIIPTRGNIYHPQQTANFLPTFGLFSAVFFSEDNKVLIALIANDISNIRALKQNIKVYMELHN